MKNVIKNTVVNLIERIELNAMSKELLLLSDRQLDDIGLSRARLEKGAKAYPWKVEATPDILGNLVSLNTRTVACGGEAQNDSGNHFDSPQAA